MSFQHILMPSPIILPVSFVRVGKEQFLNGQDTESDCRYLDLAWASKLHLSNSFIFFLPRSCNMRLLKAEKSHLIPKHKGSAGKLNHVELWNTRCMLIRLKLP
jgi:hypothetical protein